MIAKVGESLRFDAFYVSNSQGKTGLTVTIDVYRNGTKVVTGGSATEDGDGFYTYTMSSSLNTLAGNYRAVFKTTDTTVDQQHIPAIWVVSAGIPADLVQVGGTTIVTGTIQAGSTTTLLTVTPDSGVSYTNNGADGFNNMICLYLDGANANSVRVVIDSAYVPATDFSLSFDEAWISSPNAGERVAILPVYVYTPDNVADGVLKRGTANVEPNEEAFSLARLIMAALNSNTVDNDGFLTLYRSDDTEAEQRAITTSAAADPITGVS